MKKYCFVLFAVFSMFAGVVAEEWVPALFRDGNPLHGFSAAEDGGICLAPKLSQWAGVSVPINRGGGHYVFTLEILPAKGEQAGAAFYLVLADGKHRMVSNTVKGGEKARRITIKYEGNVGVKGLMLKKNNKKQAPSAAFRDLRVKFIADEVTAVEPQAGEKFTYPMGERRTVTACEVTSGDKKGTAVDAKQGQYAWNTILLGKEFPAGKYQLEFEVIVPKDKSATVGLYLAGGKTKVQKSIGQSISGAAAGVRTQKITFTAAQSFSQLVVKKLSKSNVESAGIGDFTITML